MSRLIDAEKYEIDLLKAYDDVSIELDVLNKQSTVNAIIIPEGATNGNMVETMFPYGKYGTNGNEVHVFGVGGNGVLVFTLEWWNAPYKAESEDKE